ncbi:MAG: metallophosphoesterase family protein [Bacteroidales bacterium]
MRFVVGDIHGCYKTFKKLVEEIIQLSKDDKLYLVGDYVDRGPDSKSVLDYIINLIDEGYSVFPVRGNHEEMLIDAYTNQSPDNFMLWMMNGAEKTLLSYNIESYSVLGSACMNELPESHLSFLKELPYYVLLDDYIIVHAGINFEDDNPFTDYRSMVWCRDCKNDMKKSDGRIIVHGHTPTPLANIERDNFALVESQINIDTGCVYKGYPGTGNLTAIDLDSHKIYSLKNLDF